MSILVERVGFRLIRKSKRRRYGNLHDFMGGEPSLLRSGMLTHSLVVMMGKVASFLAKIDQRLYLYPTFPTALNPNLNMFTTFPE